MQSIISGSASGFNIRSLGDRVFRFSISCQQVGFHIYNLRSFECQSFNILFNLWHGGGLNYAVEFRRWEAEEQAQWTDVAYRKRPPTVHPTPLTGANSIQVSSSGHGA